MNAKHQVAAIAAVFLVAWGAARAGSDAAKEAPAQPRAAIEAEVPRDVGAIGSDIIVLDLSPLQGQASDEETAAMQMLLLQLLLMQQQMGEGDMQMPVPSAASGISI